MIGVYDYTVILTYLSLLSAGTGIIIALAGDGHPYIGVFFLLFCGLCDAFDGKVARMKKERSAFDCKYGIQIDSLSDLVAFGVLPACIGIAILRRSTFLAPIMQEDANFANVMIKVVLIAFLVLYILAALIRLAYYNVTEEERQEVETTNRKRFVGVPVTTSSLLFPFIMLMQYMTTTDLSLLYFAGVVVLGFGFLLKISVPKPGFRGIMICVAIGSAEAIALLVFKLFANTKLL